MEKSDVQGEAASNWKMEESEADKHSSDPRADALADSKMVEVHMVIKFLYVYQLHSSDLISSYILGCGQPKYP